MKMRFAGSLVACGLGVACFVLVAGCGESDATAEVSGHVTLDGNPVPYGSITMVPDKGSGVSEAAIKDGAYVMGRAPVGRVNIAVVGSKVPLDQRPKPEGREGYIKRKREEAEKQARGEVVEEKPFVDPYGLPGKYSNAATSGLTFEVKSGKNKYDVELKSQ